MSANAAAPWLLSPHATIVPTPTARAMACKTTCRTLRLSPTARAEDTSAVVLSAKARKPLKLRWNSDVHGPSAARVDGPSLQDQVETHKSGYAEACLPLWSLLEWSVESCLWLPAHIGRVHDGQEGVGQQRQQRRPRDLGDLTVVVVHAWPQLTQ